jgi:hypothetical protein
MHEYSLPLLQKREKLNFTGIPLRADMRWKTAVATILRMAILKTITFPMPL